MQEIAPRKVGVLTLCLLGVGGGRSFPGPHAPTPLCLVPNGVSRVSVITGLGDNSVKKTNTLNGQTSIVYDRSSPTCITTKSGVISLLDGEETRDTP